MEAPLIYNIQQHGVCLSTRQVAPIARIAELSFEGGYNSNTGASNYRSTLCAVVGSKPLIRGHNGQQLRLLAGIGVSSASKDEPFCTLGAKKSIALLKTQGTGLQFGLQMDAAAHLDCIFVEREINYNEYTPASFLSRRALVRMDCGWWHNSPTYRQDLLVLSAGMNVDWPMAGKGFSWWGAPVASKPKADPFMHIKSPIGLGMLFKRDSCQVTFGL